MKFNRFTGFLLGTGLGATAMLLFAPKSGKAIRRYLGHRVDDGTEVVERGVAKCQNMLQNVQDTTDRTLNRMRKSMAM